jgi:glycopeptide antibiotics resistance protein
VAFLRAVPEFLAGMLLALSVCVASAVRVGRALGTSTAVGVGIILSLGLVLSATITPQREALEFGATGRGFCDFSRIGLAPLNSLFGLNDVSVNVLLFIPLGISIGLVPRSRRSVALLLAAIFLPVAIETTQLLLPVLDRACESADVVDNLSGLVVGLALAPVGRWLAGRR